MTETLAHGYLSESTQRELSSEYQHEKGLYGFQEALHLCALDESSLSIGRVEIFLHVSAHSHTLGANILKSYSLDGSHRVLSDEYPYARVSVIFHDFAAFYIGQISHQQQKG